MKAALIALLPLLALTNAAPATHKRADCPSKEGKPDGVNAANLVATGSPNDGNIPQSQGGHHRGHWTGAHTWTKTRAGNDGGAQPTAPANPPANPPAPVAQPPANPPLAMNDPPAVQPPVNDKPKDQPSPAPSPAPAPVVPAPAPVVDDKPKDQPNPAPAPVVPAPAPVADDKPKDPPAPAPAPADSQNNVAAPPGGSVGLSINEQSGTNFASFGGKLSWYNDWALTPRPGLEKYEFVPMVHGAGSVDQFDGNVHGAKYILGFNEPDQGGDVGGTSIPAATAADLHKKWTAKVPAGVKIGSPAVARGGEKWMDAWIAACGGGCKYDFVPFHFYGTSAKDLITYADNFHKKYNKPLWLTEWACQDYSNGQICTPDQVKSFMKEAIDWFHGAGSSAVVRWAWFGAFPGHAATNGNGLMDAAGAANDVGKYYAGL